MVAPDPTGTPPSTEKRRLSWRLLDALNAPAAVLTPAGVIQYANRRLAALLCVAREHLAARPFEAYVLPEGQPVYRRLLERSVRGRGGIGEALLHGGDRTVYARLSLRRLPPPLPEGVLVLAADLTRHWQAVRHLRRLNAEVGLRVGKRTAELAAAHRALRTARASLRRACAAREAALADNQALLREVHHRVKNNLQVLYDLLFLQAETVASPDATSALQDAYGRVYVIARLHEQVYPALGHGQVHLGAYLGALLAWLRDGYPGATLRLDAPTDEVHLDLDRAVYVGLIVNELTTNSLKHAFPAAPAGEVVVRLRSAAGRLELQVRDDGAGLPGALDPAHAKTLGFRIVHILARRLHATLTVESDSGTCVTVSFPVEEGG